MQTVMTCDIGALYDKATFSDCYTSLYRGINLQQFASFNTQYIVGRVQKCAAGEILMDFCRCYRMMWWCVTVKRAREKCTVVYVNVMSDSWQMYNKGVTANLRKKSVSH